MLDRAKTLREEGAALRKKYNLPEFPSTRLEKLNPDSEGGGFIMPERDDTILSRKDMDKLLSVL